MKCKIPEEKQICKYCYWCNCNENSNGLALCESDIHEVVNVESDACPCFDYDDTFNRT